MIQTSPPVKRRISLNPSRRKSTVEPRDEQPYLQQWLRQTSPVLEVKSPHTPTNENTIVVQAEVHQERATPNQNTADNFNLDAIDIAKDAALVKSDIKRIEELILNTKDTQTKEHNTLLLLLNSIQENVEKKLMKNQILLRIKYITYPTNEIFRNRCCMKQNKTLKLYSSLCHVLKTITIRLTLCLKGN